VLFAYSEDRATLESDLSAAVGEYTEGAESWALPFLTYLFYLLDL
jgi:hypothetical protein